MFSCNLHQHARFASGSNEYSSSGNTKRRESPEWNLQQSEGFREEQEDVDEEEDEEIYGTEAGVSTDGRERTVTGESCTTDWRTADRDKQEGENEFDDDDEDQLTAIVRRQREAFSARVAAGRPSIRNQTKTTNPSDFSHPLSGANSASIARALQTNKVLREWKMLARKVLCKVARQCLAVRREKISSAKRAARECARVIRQRALLSHKAGRDAVSKSTICCTYI